MKTLTTTIQKYLEELCVKLPHRHVGSAENRAATDFFAKIISSFGFETECPGFDCIDWEYGDVLLHAGEKRFEASAGPYSLSCNVTAAMCAAATLEELEAIETTGKTSCFMEI